MHLSSKLGYGVSFGSAETKTSATISAIWSFVGVLRVLVIISFCKIRIPNKNPISSFLLFALKSALGSILLLDDLVIANNPPEVVHFASSHSALKS